MGSLKELLKDISRTDTLRGEDASIEVYADSVQQALELAAKELDTDVSALDYDILEKGTGGLFGFGRMPYHLLVTITKTADPEPMSPDDLDIKLGKHKDASEENIQNEDASYSIRPTRSGIWFTANKPKGNGKPLNPDAVRNRLSVMRIEDFDSAALDKAMKKMSGRPVRIGDSVSNAAYNGTMSVKISDDEMKAYAVFTNPKFYGRHLEADEVVEQLNGAGVVFGIKNQEIEDYLAKMDYSKPLLAAEGQKPVPGKDAYIDYKINIKPSARLDEDESGRVDFKRLGLIQNVTAGQLLAVKVPAAEGIPGLTVTNKPIPVKHPNDTSIQYGKGTILSNDKSSLTAEINGQVVYRYGTISVEPVYIVNGDVNLQTGNIEFLGAVIVAGNVLDNFYIHAGGSIEIKGTSQRASLEAEGDIIVHQGIVGSSNSYIKSTGGSVYAKFIQNANVSADSDVIVPEGILHCNIDAGNRVLCNGRRAKIAGGLLRAENEINSRFLGGEGSSRTDCMVGISPSVLQKIADLEQQERKIKDDLERVERELSALERQKAQGKLNEEKEKMLQEFAERKEDLLKTREEQTQELNENKATLASVTSNGKVCIEKTVYPGVSIFVAGAEETFNVKDEYHYIKFSASDGEIILSEYESPQIAEGEQRIRTVLPRRRGG